MLDADDGYDDLETEIPYYVLNHIMLTGREGQYTDWSPLGPVGII